MKLRTGLLALILCCASPAFLGDAEGAPAAQASASTVKLHNRNWDRVVVEARIGDNPDSAANRSLGFRKLRRGETWTIQSRGEDVWYRRAADPNRPDGRWTDWTHRPCYPRRPKTYHEAL